MSLRLAALVRPRAVRRRLGRPQRPRLRAERARAPDRALPEGETRDLGPSEPLREAYYRQALHAWTLQLARRGPSGGEQARLSREQCENLKVLGYVQTECR